jgi:hypothetical protein
VGYGQNDQGSPTGTRFRRDDVPVLALRAGVSASGTALGASEIELGESTCEGDSGGPAISETTGAIVGVASRSGEVARGIRVVGPARELTRVDDQILQKGDDSPAVSGVLPIQMCIDEIPRVGRITATRSTSCSSGVASSEREGNARTCVVIALER